MRQRLSLFLALALVLASAVLPMAQITRAAELSLNASESVAGGPLLVSGSGFAANSTVTLNWENPAGDQLATAATGATGAFSGVSITVPATAAAGIHLLYASDGTTTVAAIVTVLPSATITVSPASVMAGGSASVSGEHFTPGAVVSVRWDATDGAVLASVTANASGAFSDLTVIVPATAAAGAHTLHAWDGTHSASAPLTVTAAQATLTIAPASQIAGGTVNAAGAGYAIGETVSLRWETAAGAELASVVTDTTGAFSNVQLTIPATATAGAHTIIGLGGASLRQAAASVTVTVSTPTPQTGSLTGTVVNTETGAPVAGAVEVLKLKLVIGPGGEPEDTAAVQTTSAADGSFSFTGLAQGIYRLKVTASGYHDSSVDNIAVLAGETAVVNVALRPTDAPNDDHPAGSIGGRVTDDATGQPIARAAVLFTLTSGDDSRSGRWFGFARTNDDGVYLLNEVRAGTYTLIAAAEGYEAERVENVAVSDGAAVQVNFTLTPRADDDGNDDDDEDDRGGTRPGWGCGDRNHEHTGPQGRGGDKENPCDKEKEEKRPSDSDKGHSSNHSDDDDEDDDRDGGRHHDTDDDDDDEDDRGERGKRGQQANAVAAAAAAVVNVPAARPAAQARAGGEVTFHAAAKDKGGKADKHDDHKSKGGRK